MSKAVPRSVVILIATIAWTGAFTHGARSARVAPAVTNLATPPLPVQAPKASEAADGRAAADAAPPAETWSASEIEDAKRTCQAIAAEVAAKFEALPPRRDGACGTPAPVRLESIGADAPVRFVPAPVVTCDMLKGLARWIDRGLQPLAEEHLDSAVSEVRVISSYACRTRYGKPGARMSEHAFANALDIAGFSLADGREVTVLSDWGATKRDLAAAAGAAKSTETKTAAKPPLPSLPGPAGPAAETREAIETAAAVPPVPVRRPLREAVGKPRAAAWKVVAKPASATPRKAGHADKKSKAKKTTAKGKPAAGQPALPERGKARFLRESHRVACALFGTTLGPEANDAHRNHFHVDMFPRRNRGYCE
jgi:hypothetical protein